MVTMIKTLKNQWWRDEVWNGCLARPANIRRLSATNQIVPHNSQIPIGWFEWALPTINQNGPSCCGQAWANWLEMMLRRYVGQDCLAKGEQIDGYEIWKEGRRIYNNGDLTGGLFLEQGFMAMLRLGIIHPKSIPISIEPTMEAINAQLTMTPLVQGHVVAGGWYEPNPENGCLDHSKRPKPDDGGHATVLMAITIKDANTYLVSQNSWGAHYGWKGYFLMSADYWDQCYIGNGPFTALMPEGWESWDGWRKFVTRSAK
jgi:hypothetical protein